MPEIKLVLSDLDSTLAPHMKHEISDVVREAVIAVENQGIHISVVTGRAYIHAKSSFEVLGIDGPCVVDGGATIVDAASGKILSKQWIDVETTRQIISILKKHCSESYFDHTSTIHFLKDIDNNALKDDAPAVFAVASTMDEIRQASKELAQVQGIQFFTGMGTHPVTEVAYPAIQITHEHADKFHGVEALRKIIGISRVDTLAIGDGDNDVPLFQNARIKVAMGNATDALKTEADYVVGTLEQDGFAEAMYSYVLKKEII